MVGAIIGRGGSKIKELQEESGARINVDKNHFVVTISGDDYAVEKAREAVNAILSGNRSASPPASTTPSTYTPVKQMSSLRQTYTGKLFLNREEKSSD
jgi:polyribonucleotide nucleotidyltransferase